jgi:3-isopropylmalate dehydrogenase
MVLSAKMMLEWLGERYSDPACTEAAAAVEAAVVQTLEAKETVPDLGGDKTTMGMAQAIADAITNA